jgi:TolA-binding protein
VSKSSRAKSPKTSELAHKPKIATTASSVDINKNKNGQSASLENTDVIAQNNSVEEAAKDWTMPENDRLYFELSGEKYENFNSQQIYEKIIEKYRSNDLKAIEIYTNLLLAKYPQSHFADNALYLEGMLAFSIKSYAKSLECFQKIISIYPNGNKAVSALFAKGILYKKMNLRSESENVLTNIKTKYPGSPESLRADAEIKILKQ